MTKPALRYFVVDAFTDRPFAGNPAAVVPLPEWRDDGWLQNVAMEMNLSETAFLVKEDGGYRLRWFSVTRRCTNLRRSATTEPNMMRRSRIRLFLFIGGKKA